MERSKSGNRRESLTQDKKREEGKRKMENEKVFGMYHVV